MKKAETARPVRLWVRVEPTVMEKLDRYAGHRGSSRSALMREIIEGWLTERPDTPEGSPSQRDRIYDQSAYMRRRKTDADYTDVVTDITIHTSRRLLALKNQAAQMAAGLEEALDGLARIASEKYGFARADDFEEALANLARIASEKFPGVNDFEQALDGLVRIASEKIPSVNVAERISERASISQVPDKDV